MEDAHTCLLQLSEDKQASFFAVFDGHGGHDVAKVASQGLHKAITNNKSYREFLQHLLLLMFTTSFVLVTLCVICMIEC